MSHWDDALKVILSMKYINSNLLLHVTGDGETVDDYKVTIIFFLKRCFTIDFLMLQVVLAMKLEFHIATACIMVQELHNSTLLLLLLCYLFNNRSQMAPDDIVASPVPSAMSLG